MTLSETFQVAAFIEKLPPSWRDFKNYLKHKRKELSLEDLIVQLRIEEDNRLSEKKVGKNLEVSRANVVEGSKPNKKRKIPGKSGEGFNQGLRSSLASASTVASLDIEPKTAEPRNDRKRRLIWWKRSPMVLMISI